MEINDPETLVEVAAAFRRYETALVTNDVPVLDQYSLLCPGDEHHETINGVPLYQDSIHFTSTSGPVFWRWLAPRLQRISRGEDLT